MLVIFFSLAYFIALPAAIALALSFAIEKTRPLWSARRKLTLASLVSGLTPMSPRVSDVVASQSKSLPYLLGGLVVVFAFAALLGALVGLPIAWLRHRTFVRRNEEIRPEIFD